MTKDQTPSREEVIRWAREAGLFVHKEVQPEIERFAAIIEKRTIERCAVVCETQMDLREEASAALKAKESLKSGDEGEALGALRHESNVRLYHSGINKCAAAIRKLGEQ